MIPYFRPNRIMHQRPRWLEKAARCCRRFNHEQINELGVPEIQADEIRTIVGDKDSPVWVFTTLDVWSRLWPSTVVGRRSYRNTYALLKDTVSRMRPECFPLIVTDGFEHYAKLSGVSLDALAFTAK